MNDPLGWSLSLGQWAGARFRVHLLLLLFVVLKLLDAALTDEHPILPTAAWLVLLFCALLVHEFAHLATALRLGSEPDDVRLWPLGNMIVPRPTFTPRGPESILIASAGLVASGAVALAVAIGINLAADAQMIFNPFGNAEGGGAPLLSDGRSLAPAFSALWWAGWFGYLNWILFLANLIPALPLDMGRILRGLTESPWSAASRDNLIGPWAARVSALVLGIGGLIRFAMQSEGGLTLIMLGVFIYLFSRHEARMLDDGAFYDESLFGYDFSQGYTSLEASSAATVSQPREGVIARWRRRRSELRRRRQGARATAEEHRMDEILDKIHREGRAALSSSEKRFLVRVSERYKNRPRSRD